MAPVFTAASFPGIIRPSPIGVSGAPTGASDAVSLTLSDGSVAQVVDTLETALKCMEFMRQRDQWLLQISDDVAAALAGPKLLLIEMGLTQQKLLASFSPSYNGGAATPAFCIGPCPRPCRSTRRCRRWASPNSQVRLGRATTISCKRHRLMFFSLIGSLEAE